MGKKKTAMKRGGPVKKRGGGMMGKKKMAKGGRIEYQNGSMPSFQAQGLPGFLTNFGLNPV